MKDSHPDFLALSKIEEDLLVSKLDAARKAISHAGEKGRSLEVEVTTLLRSFLPEEYGLTTGFVVYHTHNGPSLSPQLDVIIYDPVRRIMDIATAAVIVVWRVGIYQGEHLPTMIGTVLLPTAIGCSHG